ncbi:hypothetical protein [Streptosporangium sp. NPDC000396]|uniref:hypothetical protein n=1 Tax=Streptosporangium sp. NPDC000396 TaxID=3366185 RepID=UPI0036939CCA
MFWKRAVLVVALLPLAAALAGQSSASADSVTGVVRAVPDVGLRAEPRTDSPVPTRIPTGHQGTVSCYVRGSQNISGWGGTNPYWNYTHIDGRTGYIPDVWLDTGGDITDQVPECDQGRKRPEEPGRTQPPDTGADEPGRKGTAGEACVFLAPKGASVDLPGGKLSLGHVGWGYRAGDGVYVYGSTENPTAKFAIKAGADNGAWSGSGTRDDMLREFRSGGHSTNAYTTYKCGKVSSWDAGAAREAAQATMKLGYTLFTNNCMDHTYRVLSAYGAALPKPGPSKNRVITSVAVNANLPSWIPKIWFKSIPWAQTNL